jgi:hypothetical protein
MEAICSSETLVNNYTTWHQPKEEHLQVAALCRYFALNLARTSAYGCPSDVAGFLSHVDLQHVGQALQQYKV